MDNAEKKQLDLENMVTDDPGADGADMDEETPVQGEISPFEAQLAEQTKLVEDYFNRLARVQADYDNFKRRTRQEKEELYKYASEQVITALLPVLDNFNRAMAVESGSMEDFKSGIDMIQKQLWNVLQAEGLKEVPAIGEPFDPAVHEAVLREASDDYPENTVIEELQRGYLLKEKLIRVAMVKISCPT